MRLLIATAILAVPGLALGQDRIPEPMLLEHYQTCVSECSPSRGEAYCTQVCTCVNDELRQHFTAAEFKARTDALSQNAEDPQVKNELNQMVAYCAQRMGQ